MAKLVVRFLARFIPNFGGSIAVEEVRLRASHVGRMNRRSANKRQTWWRRHLHAYSATLPSNDHSDDDAAGNECNRAPPQPSSDIRTTPTIFINKEWPLCMHSIGHGALRNVPPQDLFPVA